MKRNTKAFLATLLLFFITPGIMAQEKYEYATITQFDAMNLRISIQGKPFEVQPLPKGTGVFDHAILFDYVSKMQNEGWEVLQTHEGAFNNVNWLMSFILRKKKN